MWLFSPQGYLFSWPISYSTQYSYRNNYGKNKYLCATIGIENKILLILNWLPDIDINCKINDIKIMLKFVEEWNNNNNNSHDKYV